MDEVLPLAAHLPKTVVWLPPSRGKRFQHNWPQSSAALGWRHARLERLKHCVGDLAIDVELQLLGCVIANAHWRGVLIAGQPRDNQFRQPSLPAHAIHDLDLTRTAGNSPGKPVPPGARFVVVAEIHK